MKLNFTLLISSVILHFHPLSIIFFSELTLTFIYNLTVRAAANYVGAAAHYIGAAKMLVIWLSHWAMFRMASYFQVQEITVFHVCHIIIITQY